MSIKKLAESLGLSKSTVSRALNGYSDVNSETRQRVFKAAKEMNYKPNPTAKRLASGKSRNVGIILPSNSRMFVSPAFSKVLAGAANFLSQHGYQLIVTTVSSHQNELKVYQDFISSGLVDGLLVVRTRHNDERIVMLREHSFPFICHGYTEDFDTASFVDVDNTQAFYQLTKREIEFGHQRIAFIDGPSDLTLSIQRCNGFQKAMSEADLPVNPLWIRNGELSDNCAMNLAKELLSLAQRPTAILCADDNMAMGTAAACEELGYRVGIDISIAGYGDYELGRYSKPAITTIRYETHQVGEQMAMMMLNKLEKKNFPVKNWYQPTIVARQSDGPIAC